MIRTLLVVRDLYDSGGVNNVACSLAERMAPDVEFYVLSNRLNPGLTWAKRHLYLPLAPRVPILADEMLPLVARGAFKKAVDSIRPDLVHVHTPTLIPPKGVPSLVMVHGTYLKELPYLWRYPLPPFTKAFQAAYTYNVYAIERFLLRYYDRYNVPSTKSRDEIIGMGVRPDLVSLVPNGVDIDRFRPADGSGVLQKYDLPKDAGVVLSVGSIVPRKGHHAVAATAGKVLAAHGDAEYVFIGPMTGSSAGYVKAIYDEARRAGVPANKLHFLGAVPSEDLIAFYNACSVFASGSFQEGFGLNILEAAACARSVVSCDVGAARDILGEHGYVAPVGDTAALADGIVKALDRGRTVVPALRNRVERLFNWDKIAKDMVRVYEETAALTK